MASSLHNEIFVILNPMAKGERARALRKNLDRFSSQALIKLTSAAGEATQLARHASEQGFRTIVAAGGDGTLNEVVNGLAYSQARLGVLPLGTVNVFARETGIPLNLDDAWNVILKGNERTIDLAKANEKYFVQLAGVGLDAQTIKETTFGFKKIWGPMSYVFNSIRIASQPAPRITLTLPDGLSHEGCFALVGNGRFYGGSFPFFHDARLDDGLLDICLFKSQKHIDLLRYFHGALFKNLSRMKDVVYAKASSARIQSEKEIPIEIDGEFSGALPVEFSVQKAGLRVIVP
ncbi:diacylglycerol kinase family lipid kinase [Kamptonema cortianum]|nr:diacylglycerol kinase family lipid kinase [Kamptonema cortianum]MDL5044510.1 diacylglycerol kinase family lipid kinase [Oscillatoria amoena NRMC-F 0135]